MQNMPCIFRGTRSRTHGANTSCHLVGMEPRPGVAYPLVLGDSFSPDGGDSFETLRCACTSIPSCLSHLCDHLLVRPFARV